MDRRDNLDYAEKIIGGLLDDKKNLSQSERDKQFESELYGAHKTCLDLEETLQKCQRALGISLYVMSALERLTFRNKEIFMIINETRSVAPYKEIAEANILLSQITPQIRERIQMSIYNAHPLFDKNTIDRPVSDLEDE